jgi:hypothetical protein
MICHYNLLPPRLPGRVEGPNRVQGLSSKNRESFSAEGPAKETSRFRTIASYSQHLRFWFDAYLDLRSVRFNSPRPAEVISLTRSLLIRFL